MTANNPQTFPLNKFYQNAANALGANKAMIDLMNQGNVSYSEGFEEAVVYGEAIVAKGIADGSISRLAALQEEGRGGKEVRDHYAK